jgi:two-component system chemotaxis response regulator CheB
MSGPDVPVVALVCSAGGLDATSRVLRLLPKGFPAAVVVLQHTQPDAQSWLVDILARRTALPVVQAVDGMALAPACVVVVPPGQHLLVTAGGTAALVPSGGAPPSRPSADLLLTSLALAVGPRAIAVVLSGHGHDGATGATVVHRFGGVVVASDEASSVEFSMPQATIDRPGVVDHVAPVDDIPALLMKLVGRASPSSVAGQTGP